MIGRFKINKSKIEIEMTKNLREKFDIKKGIAGELIKSMQSQMTSERKKISKKSLDAAKNIQKSDE